MNNLRRLLLFVLLFSSWQSVPTYAIAADIAGSQDHPLFPRFAGSEIIAHKTSDFDEFTFALGKAYEASSSNYVLEKKQTVEGRVTRTLYLAPPEKTTLQVLRNYENTLNNLGFEPLFSCKGNGECGWNSWFAGAQNLGGMRDYALQLGNDFRFLATRLSREKGDVYVSLLVYKYDSSVMRNWQERTMAELNIVEIEPMTKEMVKVTAENLAKDLFGQGHASVTQILFDTDKAMIKKESRPVLDEIAKLLKNNPELNVIFVGHTDSQGEFQYNMDLSTLRAKSVRDSIRDDYGIDNVRLGAAGLGYLAPVASNRTEEGRAMNRRVEIIEQ